MFWVFWIFLMRDFIIDLWLVMSGFGWKLFIFVMVLMIYIMLLYCSKFIYGLRLCLIGIVFRRKLNWLVFLVMVLLFVDKSILFVFKVLVFLFFWGEVVIIIICEFKVWVNFIFIWLSLLRLMMFIVWFFLIF